MLLEEDALNDSSSSDSSMEGMVITLDQDLSFLIDIAAVQETIAYSNYIFRPLLDKTIDFAAPPLKIIDLDES